MTETIEKSIPLSPKGSIELGNVNGSIEISAWDKNELSLVAEKRAKSDEDLQRIEVKIDETPDRITIETNYAKRLFGNNNGSVHYELKVPAGCSLDKIHTVDSGITVKGVQGALHLTTVNGSIHTQGSSNDLRLSTVNGNIHAEASEFPKDASIKIETVNGSCTVALPASLTAATIDASTVNGKVKCEFPVTLESSSRRSLKAKLGEGGALIKLRAVNGSLKIEKI